MPIHRSNGVIAFDFEPGELRGRVTLEKGGGSWSIDLTSARGVRGGAPEPTKYVFPWECHAPALEKLRALSSRDLLRHRETERGVELEFEREGAQFRILFEIDASAPELLFTLSPTNSGSTDLVAAELPGPILPADGRPTQVLVGAMDQGRLYTGKAGNLGWGGRDLGQEIFLPEGRMRWRWWGVMTGGSGYCAIIEENADAELALRRDASGKLTTSLRWLPSMGLLSYERRIHYCFEVAASVTSLAKRFRRYAQANGLFMTLLEKAERRPLIRKLMGATLAFIGYEMTSQDYVGTFEKLRQMGHQRFYVFPVFHVNHGFKAQGADAEIAGSQGSLKIDLRAIIPALRKLGAIVGSWVYLEGLDLAFKPELERIAQMNAEGTRALNWRRNQWLWTHACRRRLPESVRAFRDELAACDAAHFDTTTSNALMECFDKYHPHDRRQDRELRIEELNAAAELALVVASEGCRDWAIPHCDIASNKAVARWGEDASWWSVPLQQLVYHDAIISNWWECHSYDCPEFGTGGKVNQQALTDTLYGDPPLLFPVGGQKTGGSGTNLNIGYFEQSLGVPLCRQAAERAVEVARFHERVGVEEMMRHEFLTEDGAVQQTAFASGARVIVNFGAEPYCLGDGRTVPSGGHLID